MSEPLQPCPFCGGSDVLVVERDVEPQQDPWYGKKIERFVECQKCTAVLFNAYWHDGFSSDDDATEAWNKRAAAPALAEALAEAHSYLTEYRDDLVDGSCIHDDDGRALRETMDGGTQPFVEELETLIAKISAALARARGGRS